MMHQSALLLFFSRSDDAGMISVREMYLCDICLVLVACATVTVVLQSAKQCPAVEIGVETTTVSKQTGDTPFKFAVLLGMLIAPCRSTLRQRRRADAITTQKKIESLHPKHALPAIPVGPALKSRCLTIPKNVF